MVSCKNNFVLGTLNAMFILIVEVLYFPYPLIAQKYFFTVGVDQVETTQMSQTVLHNHGMTCIGAATGNKSSLHIVPNRL